jgi:outer membrane receptor protein involved in Fe transport
VLNAFTGKSATWIVDAVFKWSPQGNTARQQLKIQGEYMRRKEDGDLTFDVEGQGLVGAYASEHAGWYLQSVFQFRPRWRVGLRYDALDSGTPDIALVQSGLLPAAAFPVLLPADPERISVMLDWNPTEFSRLRAQYAWDDARATGDQDRQLFLQYLFGIGAHGAHKF